MHAMRASTIPMPVGVAVPVAVPGGLVGWLVLVPPLVVQLGLQVANALLHRLHVLGRGVRMVRMVRVV